MRSPRFWSGALVALALTVLVLACDQGTTTPTPDSFTLTVTLEGLGVGTVSNDETGIACDTTGATCSADIPEGTEVTLTATPAAGSEFVGWGTDGTANPLTFTMSGDKDVTAEFDNPALAMETVGSAGGTVMSRDSAITLVIPEGALSGDEDITIEILDTASLGAEWAAARDTAPFAAAYEMGPDGLQFSVPVTVQTAGPALETSADTLAIEMPDFLTMDGDSVVEVDSAGATVDAETGESATIATLSHFTPLVEWNRTTRWEVSGVPDQAAVGETVRLDLTAYYSHTTVAAYLQMDVPVAHASEGVAEVVGQNVNGTHGSYVEIRCTSVGPAFVTVTARGFRPGGGDGSHRNVTFLVKINCVGATLHVTTSGQGTGTVTGPNYDGSGQGINCGSQGADCTEDYATSGQVTLTPVPDDGSYFAGWTVDGAPFAGDQTGTAVLTMDGDHTVDAEFEPVVPEELTVDLSGDGDGTVVSDPVGIDCTKSGTTVTGTCTATFDHGSTVALTATDGDGSTITDWSGDGITNAIGQRLIQMTAAASVAMVFPNVPTAVTVLQLAALQVYYLEALSLVQANFPFATPAPDLAMDAGQACPTVLAAGDGAVLAINSCTGALVQQYDFSSTFYDAWAIPGPDSVANANAIFASGQNYAIFWIDDTGAVTDQIGQVNWGTALDATPINGDPKNGLAVTVDDGFGQILYFVRYDPGVGYIRVLDNYFGVTTTPPSMQSAYTAGVPADPAGQPEEAIAVGHTFDTGQIWYMESITDQYPVGSYVADLPGADPRRIRCDLATGICAVTDFTNSLVTIVLWSGTGTPTVAEHTTAGQVADGPVGLDVFGHTIVTAGYNDNQYSIIQVDDTGAIVSVSTQALPTGCTQPGHAEFLRDGANTVLVSCNGSQAIVRIPNAF